MSNLVNIPESIKDIKNAIARRMTILAEWNAMLAKTRCKVRRHTRQLQADATKAQIALLREALASAEKQAEINGLFDWKKPWQKPLYLLELLLWLRLKNYSPL